MYQNQTFTLGGTQIILAGITGTVHPTLITPPPLAVNGMLKYISGGSVQIYPNYISGATMAGVAVGSSYPGYLLGSEAYEFKGPAQFYLGCIAGASAAVDICWHFGAAGATIV